MIDYNLSALMGQDVTDQDYVDSFNAPQELVGTPEINDWMLKIVEDQNIQTFLSQGKSLEVATKEAADTRESVSKRVQELLAEKGLL